MTIRAVIAVTVLAVSSWAQHPCTTNLVPNGSFSSLLVNPWGISGPGTGFPSTFNTNAQGTSPCYQMSQNSPGFAVLELRQPTPINLSSQKTYEFSIDVWSPVDGYSVGVGLSAGSTRTSIGSVGVPTRGGPLFNRIAFAFSPPSSGAFVLDLRLNLWQGRTYRVDNVQISEAREARIDFYQARATSAVNPYTIFGPPNSVYALFLASGISPVPIGLPGCAGEWLLTSPAYTIQVAGLNQNGRGNGSINVPSPVANVPLSWQVFLLPSPSCAFGCPLEIAFP